MHIKLITKVDELSIMASMSLANHAVIIPPPYKIPQVCKTLSNDYPIGSLARVLSRCKNLVDKSGSKYPAKVSIKNRTFRNFHKSNKCADMHVTMCVRSFTKFAMDKGNFCSSEISESSFLIAASALYISWDAE